MKKINDRLTAIGTAQCQLCRQVSKSKKAKPRKCVEATIDGKTGTYCFEHLEYVMVLAHGFDDPEPTPLFPEARSASLIGNGHEAP